MAGNTSDGCSRETQEEFIARISDKVSGGLACIALAMGIETGLFQVMIDQGGPKTCQEIADAGKYKERYVREWLGSMAANDIVEYNAADGTYFLPPNRHCISDTTRATAKTLAIPNLSSEFFHVAECFKDDGPEGVYYEHCGNFVEMMTKLHDPESVFLREYLVQSFLPAMPTIHRQLQDGIQVLDIGCSLGTSTLAIAKTFPNSQVYGIDISELGIRQAQEAAKEMGLSNVQFIRMSATDMPVDWSGKFDYIYMQSVLHHLPSTTETLGGIRRVLKSGGTMSIIEMCASLYAEQEKKSTAMPSFGSDAFVLSFMYCVPLPGDDECGACGADLLGRDQVQEMLKAAQFEVVSVTPVTTFESTLHYQCQKV